MVGGWGVGTGCGRNVNRACCLVLLPLEGAAVIPTPGTGVHVLAFCPVWDEHAFSDCLLTGDMWPC